ncbi:6-pyruvoyltetrahydropterin/6-carboxytetrahydropterin synthase [Gammaproteobacteria bacterium]
MYTIITRIKYEYAHRLIHHQGKCRNIHGHSGEATIELIADALNNDGFVMDFGDIKTHLKKWMNECWDHAYLANENDPLLPGLRDSGMKIFTFSAEPSAEVMAQYLFEKVSKMDLRSGVKVARVTIQETCTGLAVYELTAITNLPSFGIEGGSVR